METIPLEVIKEKIEDNSKTGELLSVDSFGGSHYRNWLDSLKIVSDITSNTSSSIVDCFTFKTKELDSFKIYYLTEEESREYNNFFIAFYDKYSKIDDLISVWNTNMMNYFYRYLLNESSKQNVYQDYENFLDILVVNTGIKEVCKDYTLKNFLEINRFLTEESYLIFELKEIYTQINKYFKKNLREAILKYIKDPEEDFEGLFITIKTELSFDKAFRILNKFFKEYWFNLNIDLRKTIGITIDKK